MELDPNQKSTGIPMRKEDPPELRWKRAMLAHAQAHKFKSSGHGERTKSQKRKGRNLSRKSKNVEKVRNSETLNHRKGNTSGR